MCESIPFAFTFIFQLHPYNRCSVKTKVQQRALAGDKPRTLTETIHRLLRGIGLRVLCHRLGLLMIM